MSKATDFGALVVGSAPIFRVEFENDGVAADPTTVTFAWKIGSGSTTTYTYGGGSEIVKDSTGNYHVQLSITGEGRWYGRWVGTGTVKAASELTFMAWTNF